MLKGRLGLQTARVPHADRHGILWLEHGRVYVEDGTLRFVTAGCAEFKAGDYAIPFQTISSIFLGPGSTVTHDSLRILARHGTSLLIVGSDGTRFYASLPAGPDSSRLARRQVEIWSDAVGARLGAAHQLYSWRFGAAVPTTNLSVLRGIEGSRMKAVYDGLAKQYGVPWKGRNYDRMNPEKTDAVNMALNHAATATQAAAMAAVAATGTIPQLGFIHEDSGNAFALDIADLYRHNIMIPIAFSAFKAHEKGHEKSLEATVRKRAAEVFRSEKLIPSMIDRIKELLG